MKRNRLWQGLVLLSSLGVALMLTVDPVPIASAAAGHGQVQVRPLYIECSTTTSHIISDGGWWMWDTHGDGIDPILVAQVDARDGAYCGSLRGGAIYQVNTNLYCHIQADLSYFNSWADQFQRVKETMPGCNVGTKTYTYYTGWQAQNNTVPYYAASFFYGLGQDSLTPWKCADGTNYAVDGNGNYYCPY